MKIKQTIVLILVVVVLVAAYLVFFQHRPTTGPAEDKGIFPGVNADKITAVTITLADRKIALQKQGEDWVITEPMQVKAAASAVNVILTDLEGIEPQRTITRKDDPEMTPAKYGLDKPAARVEFTCEGRAHEVQVGALSPSAGYYAATPERADTIYLIPAAFFENIDREPNDLRDRRPLVFEEYAVTRIELQSVKEPQPFIFSRENDQGIWRVAKPIDGRADQNNIRIILRTLLDFSVLDFSSDDPGEAAQFGFDKPDLTLTLLEGERAKTLQIAAPAEQRGRVFARLDGSPSVFRIDPRILTEIDKPLNYYRDKDLFRLRAQDADRITIEIPDRPTTVLELEAGAWRLKQPYEHAVRPVAVESLLGALQSAKIHTWAAETSDDLARYGLDKPSLTLTVALADGSTHTVQFGRRTSEGAGSFFVRRLDEPPILSLPATIYDDASEGYLGFLDRRLLNLKVAEAVRLEIKDQDGRDVLCERVGEDQWQVVKPFTLKADLANVNDVLIRIATLQCFGYVTDDLSKLTDYGLEPPARTVSVAFRTQDPQGGEATQTYTVRIGNMSGEFYNHGFFEGSKHVVLFNRDIYKEAGDEMVTLQIFKADPAAVQQIEFVYPDQTVTVRRAEAGWQITQPEQADADSDIVAQLLEITQSIKAAGYADYKPADLATYGLDAPALRLRLTRDDGLTHELLIGKEQAAGLVYAKDRDADAVFLLPAALVNDLQKKAPDLEPLAPLAPAP